MIVRAICSIYDYPQLQKALNRSRCYSNTAIREDLVPNPSIFPHRFRVEGHLTNDPTPLWKLALHNDFKGQWSYSQQSGSQLTRRDVPTVREQYILFCFENETDMVYGRMIANGDDIEDGNISFLYDNGEPECPIPSDVG